MHRDAGHVVVLIASLALWAAAAQAQSEFPYDRDLVLDARAMRGGKRVPVLSVEQNGRAQIDHHRWTFRLPDVLVLARPLHPHRPTART